MYSLTDAGAVEIREWRSELIATPTRDYTPFEAGLSFLPALPPDRVRELLSARAEQLERESANREGSCGLLGSIQVPRLFWVEEEYRDSLRTAELAYIRQLVNDIDNDDLEGIDWWHQIHNEPGRQQRDALLGDPRSRGGSSDSAATVAAEQERPVVSAGEISIRCRRARLRLRRVGANLRNDSPRVFLYISHPGALPAKT